MRKSKAGVDSLVSVAQTISNEFNAIEIVIKENLESQRRQCLLERREKYERRCIQSKLNNAGGGCRMDGKDGQFVGCKEAEKDAKLCSPSIKVTGAGDKVQVNNPEKVSGVHHCKGKTACSVVWMSAVSVTKVM